MAQPADFLVSYTSADRAWAEWIAWQLEAEGYQVIIQAWDFTAGRDWAHEMQHATATGERVVAVLSAAYLRSAHGEAEWRAFYAQDPSGDRGLLLPVRVDKVEPPGLLKTRIYVDLVDQEAAGARLALLAAARGARGKPTQEPEFPGDQRPAASPTEAPRFPGELPPVWNVPYHPNPYFTGRELLLAEVHARLTASERDVRRVTLTGLGGVGKTQLVVEYAYRRRPEYDLVWWVRGEQPVTLLGDYAALANQSPLASDLRLAKDASQEAAVAAVRAWLERHPRWLLVFDNADEPQAMIRLLPRSGAGHVLVTSRAETGWEQLTIPVSVDVLSPADAAAFLLARTGDQGPAAKAAATTLATTLGGLPLALEQAGAYVATTGTVTMAGYAELFGTRALELLRRGQPLGYQHTVATTWSLALERLRKSEPAAVDLLTLASFLAPDDLPEALVAAYAQELPEPLASAAADPLALADTVGALRRYSLIRVIADGLYFHRLLQTVVRGALNTQAADAWATAAVQLLRAGFPHTSDDVSTWAECERLLPHVLAVAEHGQHLTAKSESLRLVLSRAAQYLYSRGQYRQALTLRQQVFGAYQKALGDDHPDTLQSMHHLAETRRILGALESAHDLFERALSARRRVLGDDHPGTLESMHGLAVTLRNLGDLQGAHRLHEQTLTTRRQVLGNEHPDTLQSMHHLAAMRRDLGDQRGAHELFEQTVTGYRRVLGDDHPTTLNARHGHAVTRQALGDLQGAHDMHERIGAARRRVLGDDHPDTLWSMHKLAEARGGLGNLQGAHDMHAQILTIRRRVLGDEHPNTLSSMYSLAETRQALGDINGALELHEQALATRRRVLGEDHPDTRSSTNKITQIRRELSR